MVELIRGWMSGALAYLAKLFRSRTFWQGTGAISAFWTAAYFLPFLLVYVTVSVILLCVSLGVLFRYLPGFLEAMVAGRLNDGEQLVLGIWVAWLGDVMLRFWAVTQRALDQPEWMLTSDFVSFIIFIKVLGSTLHLTSPGSIEGRIPTGNWVMIAMLVAFAIGVAVALLVTSYGATVMRGF